MRTMVSREARIIDEHRPFLDTIGIYQDALSFLINVADGHYGGIRNPASQKAMTAVERMVHSTSSRKAIHPSFDIRFPKFPSYLRRAAIFEAIAAVMLYRRNLADWESSDRKRRSQGKSSWLVRTCHMHPVHLHQSSCGDGFGLS